MIAPGIRRIAIVFAALVLAGLSSQAGSIGKAMTPRTQKTVAAAGVLGAKDAQQDFQMALTAFNSGKFRDATVRFDRLQTCGFAPDAVHYYLALSYQNCNQVGLAQSQYMWVVAHTKNATLRRYSQCGIDILASYSSHRTFDGQCAMQKVPDSLDGTSTSTCSTASNMRTGPDGKPILQWGDDGLPG